MKLSAVIIAILTTCSNLLAQDKVDDQNIDGFVVVVDTSEDYFLLRNEMFKLNELLQLDIDTMGRGFNQERQEIALPDWDTGQYFPRRYEGKTLSLEQLPYYKTNTTKKTMVLVAGLFYDMDKATEHLEFVKTKKPTAYILKTRLYMGCMH